MVGKQQGGQTIFVVALGAGVDFTKSQDQSYLELGLVTRPNLGLSMQFVYLAGLVLTLCEIDPCFILYTKSTFFDCMHMQGAMCCCPKMSKEVNLWWRNGRAHWTSVL